MNGANIQIKISHLIVLAMFIVIYPMQANDTNGSSPAAIGATATNQRYGENRFVTEIILTNASQLTLNAPPAGTEARMHNPPVVLAEVKATATAASPANRSSAAIMLANAIMLAITSQILPWLTGFLACSLALLILLRIRSLRSAHQPPVAPKTFVAPPPVNFNRARKIPLRTGLQSPDAGKITVTPPSKFSHVQIITLRSALEPPDARKIILAPPKPVQILPPRLPLQPPDAGTIRIPPSSKSAPYVQIEMEGSTQTQSQTCHPGLAVGNETRMPEAARLVMPETAPAVIPAAAQAVMPEAVRAGIIANLSQWLKKNLVRRLLSDRTQLIATQQAAALTALAVDKRLTKIEHQIDLRNKDYERRIDELLKALITAEAENREMIRAQITFLKVEMEKERLKARHYDDEHERY